MWPKMGILGEWTRTKVMAQFGFIVFFLILAYIAGFYDGFKSRPPEPLKGNYDSGEHEDRVDEYGDWS